MRQAPGGQFLQSLLLMSVMGSSQSTGTALWSRQRGAADSAPSGYISREQTGR